MKTLTTAGGNLFDIAARQLGDATQWVRIAALNGLDDPMLQGVVTLKIPDVDPSAGGGVGSQ
jgi:nucleoid-associated protein YgaU